MTANQFCKRRKKLFRSQQAAADALGVTPGAVSHWESGRRAIPAIIEKFLECLIREVKE
jgi:predicted transcriptional regulator